MNNNIDLGVIIKSTIFTLYRSRDLVDELDVIINLETSDSKLMEITVKQRMVGMAIDNLHDMMGFTPNQFYSRIDELRSQMMLTFDSNTTAVYDPVIILIKDMYLERVKLDIDEIRISTLNMGYDVNLRG